LHIRSAKSTLREPTSKNTGDTVDHAQHVTGHAELAVEIARGVGGEVDLEIVRAASQARSASSEPTPT
jgi:hypothetical protein